tara:strand:+ start:505 stop:1062 length:558 start_codon:yes stop_codon:yes gene_type:complete
MKNPKELFESIVNLSKKVLGEDIVDENVILAHEVVEVEPKEEEEEEAVAPVTEAPVVAPVEQPAAVSKSEFDSAIAEIKEMYTKVLESISPSQPQEVPESLSEVVTEEEVNEEVSLEEVVTEEVVLSEEASEEVQEVELKEEVVLDELVHDPEVMVEKKQNFLYAQNRVQTTEDVVFNSLFNNKN